MRNEAAKGLEYGPGVVGKFRFRIRETHARDHLVPLLRKGATGAAKLDLVLRGLALNPEHTGNRPIPGIVIGRYSYEDLHDLTRGREFYGPNVDDPRWLRLKRKWVGEQLQRLEQLNLVTRNPRRGRPELIVLRDDGSGEPFDDPSGRGADSYVTILGAIIASQELATWGAPEVAFYLAAMVAERYEADRRRRSKGESASLPFGGGEWFQTLDWFSNARGYRLESHVVTDFSTATLQRGLRSFKERGLVWVERSRNNPLTGARFKAGSRNIYSNRFNTLEDLVSGQVSADDLEEAIAKIEEAGAALQPST